MPRLMSVSLTEDAVRARTKTVTRRLGWTFLKPGDRLTLCRKVMGRRRRDGTVEPLVRICDVEVVSVRVEPLAAITAADVDAEGVPSVLWDHGHAPKPERWARWYAETMKLGSVHDNVTRIEFRYLP